MKSFVTRCVVPLLMLILSGVAFFGQFDSFLGKLGADGLQAKNESYLEETFNKALVGFGVMSGLKAGLAVVEGSTGGVSAGVSLNLQIGDVVQSAYDYVDIAWRTLLLGSICLLSIQYLLDAVSLLDSVVLGLFWLLMACAWLGKGRAKIFRDAFLLSIFAVLVVYLLLPVSILISSQLSDRITRPSIEAAQLGFEQTSQQLFPENKDLPEGFVARIKKIPERLEQLSGYLSDRTAQMSLWTVQLIAGYLFDCILFPFGTFLLLIAGTRALLRYCYACGLHKALYNELRKRKD